MKVLQSNKTFNSLVSLTQLRVNRHWYEKYTNVVLSKEVNKVDSKSN